MHSYQVPSLDGTLIRALPLKLCLRFKPPTIAVVYQIERKSKRSEKKYIHEIMVQKMARNENLHTLCDKLCAQEA